MCCVADLNASDGAGADNQQGVLTNLPRTRPQRATPRRAAARARSNGAPSAKRARARSSAPPRETSARTARPRASAGAGTATRATGAPVQGFECEAEARGSVQPPGAVELVSSLAEVVSELAKAGASRSERLLRDLASRLPLS
jgi:hypothetical protein